MSKKPFLVACLAVIYCISTASRCFSQQDTISPSLPGQSHHLEECPAVLRQGYLSRHRASIQLELGGPSLLSLNFDQRFSSRPGGLGFRVGAGANSFMSGSYSAFIPLCLNYLIAFDRVERHFFETGTGIARIVRIKYMGGPASLDGYYPFFIAGYRLQPIKSGFTVRAFYSPIIYDHQVDFSLCGISFGYKF